MKILYRILIIALISILGCINIYAENNPETALPQVIESNADFSAELPVNDLLVGDLVYINFGIESKKNIFAFEAEIEYDSDALSFSEINSDVMEVSAVDSDTEGTVKFAASMVGDSPNLSENTEINLILKSKKGGSSLVSLKNTIIVYDDLSYTEFNDIDEKIKVSVKKVSSGVSSGSGGGGGRYVPSFNYTGGSIAIQATPTPEPTYTAPPENIQESDVKTIRFSDISEVEWAREAIEALNDKNIINGIGDGLFNPQGKITRAEFSKIIVLACGISLEDAECEYSDVLADEWYYPYIAAATKNSLLNGYASGEFRPNGYITRQEAAVICARTVTEELKPEIIAVNFNDKEEISDFAYDSVCLLYTMRVINGDNEGNFNPSGNLSRAEAAKIIYILTGGGE